MTYESTVSKVWTQPLESGGTLTVFALDGTPEYVFVGPEKWLPLIRDVIRLQARIRVTASEQEAVECCDGPDRTNVPEREREEPSVLCAEIIEWL